MKESRLLDVDNTLVYLGGISRSLLKVYVKQKLLRPVPLPNAKIAGKLKGPRFDIKDLDKFIEDCKEGKIKWVAMAMEQSGNHQEEDFTTTKTNHSESRAHQPKRIPRKKHKSFYDPEIMKLEQDYHLPPLK